MTIINIKQSRSQYVTAPYKTGPKAVLRSRCRQNSPIDPFFAPSNLFRFSLTAVDHTSGAFENSETYFRLICCDRNSRRQPRNSSLHSSLGISTINKRNFECANRGIARSVSLTRNRTKLGCIIHRRSSS